MPYDPDAYAGLARHYSAGRPPYSERLPELFQRELALDGSGRLLDVGCGPGVLVVQLAPLFADAVALDPAPDMLAEGTRRAGEAGVANIRWIKAVAEDIASLDLGPMRVATFGQSFHWTEGELVAEVIYDLLEPGGAIVLVAHTVAGRPQPAGPPVPPIPHDEIERLVEQHLGRPRRPPRPDGSGPIRKRDGYEDTLSRTRFGRPRVVWAQGRPDIVRDIDSVAAGYLSLSWASPRKLGHARESFEADLRRLLQQHSPSGLFWDWPGDTELLIGTKPR